VQFLTFNNYKEEKEMALTDENNMVMPVAPMYGGNNGGFGGFGGDWGWIILLLLFAGGGWGNGFGGGYGNMALGYDFPWLLNGQNGINANTNAGFQNAMLNDGITSIRDGISDISTQLCNGFSGVQMSLANGFAGVEQGANARAMANMQQLFGLQSQFADCCCENRLANCQTQNIIQNEGNATRFADANNTRDLLQNQTANTQAILDKLCQLELDAKNDKISDLERKLTMANLQASQTAQNAFIQQGFSDEVDALYNRLNNCPVPTTPVYGRTPIFTCNNNNGCGCGCSGNF
jgi:hypothetical protein